MSQLMHRTIPAFFTCLLFVAASPDSLAQQTTGAKKTAPPSANCPAQTKPVDINIKNPKGRVVYNTGVSRNDLIRIRQSRSRGVIQSNWRPLGLTLSDFRFQIGTTVSLLPAEGGGLCVYPDSFDISIGYSGFKVYIDRRYGKGSCEYRAVLEHENEHVSLYRSAMVRSLPNLQRAVYSAARRITPVVVETPDQGARYMQKQMHNKLKSHVAQLSRNADVANARIDTLTSYKRVHARCRNW